MTQSVIQPQPYFIPWMLSLVSCFSRRWGYTSPPRKHCHEFTDRCTNSELQVIVRYLYLSSIFKLDLRARMARPLNVDKLSYIFYDQHKEKILVGSLSWCHECNLTILKGWHLDPLPSSAYRILQCHPLPEQTHSRRPFLSVWLKRLASWNIYLRVFKIQPFLLK